MYGRTYLTDADIALVVPLALGSCSEPRQRLIKAILTRRTISAAEAAEVLGVTKETARRYLGEMGVLGITAATSVQQTEMCTLASRWKWFMDDEFKAFRDLNPWQEGNH